MRKDEFTLIDKMIADARTAERNKIIDEIKDLIIETRSHNFGVCSADFVLDVFNSKINEKYIYPQNLEFSEWLERTKNEN